MGKQPFSRRFHWYDGSQQNWDGKPEWSLQASHDHLQVSDRLFRYSGYSPQSSAGHCLIQPLVLVSQTVLHTQPWQRNKPFRKRQASHLLDYVICFNNHAAQETDSPHWPVFLMYTGISFSGVKTCCHDFHTKSIISTYQPQRDYLTVFNVALNKHPPSVNELRFDQQLRSCVPTNK